MNVMILSMDKKIYFLNKKFLECNPKELLHDCLAQCGVKNNNIRNRLVKQAAFGSLLYINASKLSKQELIKQNNEWYFGPIQPNGYYWASNYTLYIKQPINPTAR